MKLFNKEVNIKDAYTVKRDAEKKLESVIDLTVEDNSKNTEEYNCEGEPYIYRGKKVTVHISKNMIDAYWCEIKDNVAHTEYSIYCNDISYEELESKVVKYINAMCQY